MRTLLASLLFIVAVSLGAGPVAAAPDHRAAPGSRIVAQESPSPEECVIGGICEPGATADLGGPTIDPSKVPDAPGATARTLIMLGLLATAFVVYLRLALSRGAKIG